MPVITRRAVLLSTAAAAFVTLAGRAGWAQGDRSAEATRFIDQFGAQLVQIVDANDNMAAKRQAMQPLVERAVAIADIGEFVLGRYARIATPAQKQRFLQLFHAVLINNILSKLGEFRGVTFSLTQTVAKDGAYFVGTLIKRPNQQANNAQWVVSFESGAPKIVDVIAEGTSLRLTQRSDYASFISRNGNSIDALLSALERQTAG